MSKYEDLQSAYVAQQSSERNYWNNLAKQLSAFSEQFVKDLELPSPTYTIGEESHYYVKVTQCDSKGEVKSFDAKNFEKKERSIPFTISVSVLGGPNDPVRQVGIDLTISAQKNNQPSIYSAEFEGRENSFDYSQSTRAALMNQIFKTLETKLKSTKS